MHGVVFSELKQFVEETHGTEAWRDILESADTSTNSYLELKTYPDEDIVALLQAAEAASEQSRDEILHAFGEFAASDLIQKYNTFLDDDWTAMDVLEHTEDAMHKAVRLKEDDAEPPELDCRRVDDEEVVIEYSSDLQLCTFGEGLIEGIADEYDTAVDTVQRRCMLEGDRQCEIHVSA
jgi:predicted hydrocarbon binding protein